MIAACNSSSNATVDIGIKPTVLSVLAADIPAELTEVGQWVVWRLEQSGAKWTKIPKRSDTLANASTTNSETWTTFDEAAASHERGGSDGVGFVFTAGDRYVGIDLDKCRDAETGEIAAWARKILNTFQTYAEVSPSGTGIKLIARGKLPGKGRKKPYENGAVEMYDQGRYFTITGHVVEEYRTICECLPAILALHERVFGDLSKSSKSKSKSKNNKPVAPLARLNDIQRVRIDYAKSAANGEKFEKLWNGDTGEYGNDASRADLALCGMLAHLVGNESKAIDTMFRHSGLMRPKWDEMRGASTYGEITVDKAMEGNRALRASQAQFANTAVPANVNCEARNGWWENPVDDRPLCYQFQAIDSKTFAETDYKLTWLVKRLLVQSQPAIVGAARKNLKTTIMIDLAISLGTGTSFLNHFDVYAKKRVAVLSGESGEAVLKETAKRICAAKNVKLEDADVLWAFDLPQLADPLQLDELSRGLRDNHVAVVIIDPLYLCLLSGVSAEGLSASNLYQIGPLLMAVARTCIQAGATPILVHHATKAANRTKVNQPLDLDDLAFAGVAEFARQWILISRRSPFDPETGRSEMVMAAGGSAGQSGLWAVDIEEGLLDDHFQGRIWNVRVSKHQEAKERDQDERAARKRAIDALKDEADDKSLLSLIDDASKQDGMALYTKVRTLARWNNDRMTRSVQRLLFRCEIADEQVTVPTGRGGKSPKLARALRRLDVTPPGVAVGTDGTDGTDRTVGTNTGI